VLEKKVRASKRTRARRKRRTQREGGENKVKATCLSIRFCASIANAETVVTIDLVKQR
jgi:hypothetical protein